MSIVLVPKAAYDSMTTADQEKLMYAFPVLLDFAHAPVTTTDAGVDCYVFCDSRLPPEPAPEEI